MGKRNKWNKNTWYHIDIIWKYETYKENHQIAWLKKTDSHCISATLQLLHVPGVTLLQQLGWWKHFLDLSHRASAEAWRWVEWFTCQLWVPPLDFWEVKGWHLAGKNAKMNLWSKYFDDISRRSRTPNCSNSYHQTIVMNLKVLSSPIMSHHCTITFKS